jgi:DNA polymerase-3 subunit delta
MPISLYYGDEEFLLSRAVLQLRQRTLSPELGDLAYRLLVTPSLTELLEAVGAVYFNLGGTTLIEVRGFSLLACAADGKIETAQQDQLIELLDQIEAHKHVLFVASKASKTVKLTKWLTKNSGKKVFVQEFNQFAFWQSEEIVTQIMALCHEESISVERKAVMLLVENRGSQIRSIMTELQRLCVSVGCRSITTQDVLQGTAHNDNVFKLVEDWLLQQNVSKRLQMLDEALLTQKPEQIFGACQFAIHNLFQLAYLSQKGQTESEIASFLKKHPYKVKKELELCQRISLQRLNKARTKVLLHEQQAKLGVWDGKLGLEMLFCG